MTNSGHQGNALAGRFVDVHPKAPHYFRNSDGTTFLPIGGNLCFDRLYGTEGNDRAACEERLFRRMRAFAANGGNFLRFWLGHPFFDIMPETARVFDPAAEATLAKTVKLAEELGIRLKFTLESFRRTKGSAPGERHYNPIFVKSLYWPYAKDMRAFFKSPDCFDIYLAKAKRLKALGFGDSPAVICLELWNEINATGSVAVYSDWSARMLAALKAEFPRQMVVQNLGSFSDPQDYYEYDYLASVRDNDFMQAHRYLDPGAAMDVTRGPMDVLCADSIREMLDRRPDRPALLAETGAVQSRHKGPSFLYEVDVKGTLLHDEIFAPFFAGSAGCGQPWHWDHQYLDRYNLWYHFGRFAKAVKGIDPAAENFRPAHTETMEARVYMLLGRKTTIAWCRDKASTWESELVRGVPAQPLKRVRLPFDSATGFEVYYPWEDRTIRLPAGPCVLPSFTRSCVVRFADGKTADLGIQREI